MKPENYVLVAEKLIEAVLQMEQLIDRLLTAHDENSYWPEQQNCDKEPF